MYVDYINKTGKKKKKKAELWSHTGPGANLDLDT